jgi:murein DD-endopeptidase MepM/ murein hydrolase activator NlpD
VTPVLGKGNAPAASAARTAAASASYTGPYADLVNRSARANGLDPWWLAGLLFVENRFRPKGDSSKGAVGIAQILLAAHPDVTRAQAESPAFAIPWAARYLATLRRLAGGSITTATAMYNVGPHGDVRGAGTAYVDQVKAARSDLRRTYGKGTAADASGGILRAGLAWPLAQLGKIIGRPYQGTHADFGNWESDNAVDVATPVGTPVFAVDNGVVGPQIGSLHEGGQLAGLRLHLVTGNDEFYYAHLSRLVVKAGQKVTRGQLLGYSGSANGVAHLHIAEKATYDPNYKANPSRAANVSFWSRVGKAAQSGFDAVVPGAGAIGAGAKAAGVSTDGILGPIVAPLQNLAKIGDVAGRFIDDPAYPFLWLLFMLTGFALLYLGVTRLFGVSARPLVERAVAAGAVA